MAVATSGKTRNNAGKDRERRVAAWFRETWPDADRSVRTGYAVSDRVSQDQGDLIGLPFLVQVKGHLRGSAQFTPGKELHDILVATLAQTRAARLPFGFVIEQRIGVADVGGWYAWMSVDQLLWLTRHQFSTDYDASHAGPLVRLSVNSIIGWLKARFDVEVGVPTAGPADLAQMTSG